jgi:nucleolar complex protein 3
MSTFALSSVKSTGEVETMLTVPASIRGLALLSQLAVYKDIIPGYRIRQLTATEEAEKVRDEVRRQREGEKLLIKSYKGYLKILEGEIKGKCPDVQVGYS